jgi:hypothetical protein
MKLINKGRQDFKRLGILSADNEEITKDAAVMREKDNEASRFGHSTSFADLSARVTSLCSSLRMDADVFTLN